MVPKRTPKQNPKLDPSKSCVPPKEKSRVPKRGPKLYPKRGGCGVLASSMLRRCFLKDFWAFRAYFGRQFVPTSELWALIFLCFLGSGFRISELTKLIPYTRINQPYSFFPKSCPLRAGGDARSVRNFVDLRIMFLSFSRKTMQNHYENTSDNKFWTRNVQN